MVKIKKECELRVALKEVSERNFNPLDDVILDKSYLVLSDWKIEIPKEKIILQDGFLLYEEYDPFQFSKILSCVFYDNQCLYSNRNYTSILQELLKISKDDILKLRCVLKES